MMRRWLVVGLLFAGMAVQMMWLVRGTSSTWDEPHHLFDGYTELTRGDYRLNPEVPPLVKMVAALPLLGRGLVIPMNQGRSTPTEAFLDGRAFVFGNGTRRTLDRGRLACMVFTLGLGLLIFLWTCEMFGYWPAAFALGLFVFDPNFLAHGALVTTDVGSACLFVASAYAFWGYCRRPGGWRLLLAGLCCGLLLAAKFTGVFVAPILLLLAALEGLRARSGMVLVRRVGAVLAIGVLAVAVLWGFYGFRYKAAPAGKELNPTLNVYLDRMYDRANARRLAVAAKYHLLPEAYLWGLENTKQTEFEDTSYYMGKVYRHGNRGYFVTAMLVKSTMPFLLMLAAGAVLWGIRRRGHPDGERSVGARSWKGWSWLFVLLPAGFYFAMTVLSNFDIGVRHLLPVYGFLYIVVGAAAGALLRRDVRWGWALGALLVWQMVTSLRVAPGYMAYGNEFAGGPGEVRRFLSDSNVDWGQELKGVKRYLDKNQSGDCWFAYFPDGAIEPSDYGIRCRRLPTTSTVWWLDLPEEVPPVIEGTVLISDGSLEGIEFGDGPVLNPYDSFRGLKPDAVIEGGVYAYKGRFAMALASALVTAHEADKLLAAGKTGEALRLAKAAAELMPESAPVEQTLGDVMIATGDRAGALAAFERGLASAARTRPDLQERLVVGLTKKVAGLQ